MELMMTFYGYPDNDPPGREIAYPRSHGFSTLHEEAGGIGTYDNPITVAVVTKRRGGRWDPGVRMYVPSLQKYLIVEDECASCGLDQIDIWMESDDSCPQDAVLQCEEAWTVDGVTVEIDPPPGRAVDTASFFDVTTCSCRSVEARLE